jgi:hypothetical protein
LAEDEPPAAGTDAAAAAEQPAPAEKSVTIDLVAMEPEPLEQLATAERPNPSGRADFVEPSLVVARVPRPRGRRRLGLLVLLVLLALVGGGAYHYRSRIPWQELRWFVASRIAEVHARLSRLTIR